MFEAGVQDLLVYMSLNRQAIITTIKTKMVYYIDMGEAVFEYELTVPGQYRHIKTNVNFNREGSDNRQVQVLRRNWSSFYLQLKESIY